MTETTLDKIIISDLLLRCIVGVNEDERLRVQDVRINITLDADLTTACRSDRIEDSVDYTQVRDRVVEAVEDSSFFLIEALAERIAQVCLEPPPVQRATVRIEKPGVLRFARSVGIEIERTKE